MTVWPRILLGLVFGLTLALNVTQFAQADYYVDQTFGDDANDGASWGAAKETIQAALSLATSGGTIHVAQGFYYERPTLAIAGLQLIGGYAAGGGTRNPAMYVTVIDGSLGGSVLTITAVADVTVEGFTVRNGSTDHGGGLSCTGATNLLIADCILKDNEATYNGGGAHCWNSTATFESVTFLDNYSSGSYAGGVMLANSTATFESCTFDGNTVNFSGSYSRGLALAPGEDKGEVESAYGGALYVNSTSSATVFACQFTGNICISTAGHWTWAAGGAIFTVGQLSLTNNTFTGNQARGEYTGSHPGGLDKSGWGGAICARGGSVQGIGNTYTNNLAYTYIRNTLAGDYYAVGWSRGGAYYCDTSTVITLSYETFTANTAFCYAQDTASGGEARANGFGGAMQMAGGVTANLGLGIIITDNLAKAEAVGADLSVGASMAGGAYFSSAANVVALDGAFIARNRFVSIPESEGVGGGIVCGADSNLTLHNSFIVDNDVEGIRVQGGTLTCINTTIAHNDLRGIYCYYGAATIKNCILWGNGDDLANCTATYSNIQDGDAGEGNLSPPCDPLFVGGGDYHLQPNSCCVDRGTLDQILDHDYDGDMRPYNGVAPDIGADETTAANPTPTPYVTPIGTPTAAPEPGSNFYVDGQTGDDANDGLSWITAKASISAAIADAYVVGEGVVHVAAWTYYENPALVDNLYLLGGYPPGGGARDPEANTTIIDGNHTGSTVRISGVTNVLLDGFLVRNGLDIFGGGIHVSRARGVTISNNTVTLNQTGTQSVKAYSQGGGLYLEGVDIQVVDNKITHNSALVDTPRGGGVYCETGSRISLSGNQIAYNTTSGYGGGVYCGAGSYVSAAANEVANNTAIGYGGGLYIAASAVVTVSNGSIKSNTASVSQVAGGIAAGGGVYCEGQLTLSGNLLEANQAYCYFNGPYAGVLYLYAYGGALYCASTAVVISSNNEYTSNVVNGSGNNPASGRSTNTRATGGAILCMGNSNVQLTHDVLRNNQVLALGQADTGSGTVYGYGGAIHCRDTTIVLIGTGTLIESNSVTATAIGSVSAGGNAWGGGVCVQDSGSMVVFDGATLKRNTLALSPGYSIRGQGVNIYSAATELYNTVIAEHDGDGLYFSGNVKVVSCTIADNTGAGIYCYTGTPTITNCILWGNGDDLYGCTATYSNIQGGDAGTGNLNPPVNPIFLSAGDYHLSPSSPCIDRGNAYLSLNHDLDGEPRPWNGGFQDIGADEVSAVNPTPTPAVSPVGTPTAAPTPTTDLYVDGQYGDDANDGLSWAEAKASIQSALTLAEAHGGASIHIAGTVYEENIVLSNNNYLFGGYPPGGGTRQPSVHITVIDGGAKDSSVRIGRSSNIVVDGFRITNGSGEYGGGISINGAEHVAIRNNVITANACRETPAKNATKGGGLYVDGSDIVLENNQITNNYAQGSGSYGGGVFVAAGPNLVFLNNVINANTADSGGGGIAIANPTQTFFTDNEITTNTCFQGHGGGLYIDYTGNAVLSGNLISSNFLRRSQVDTVPAYGGGIACWGRLILTGNELIGNECRAEYSGATEAGVSFSAKGAALYVQAGVVQSIGNHYQGNSIYILANNTTDGKDSIAVGQGGAIFGASVGTDVVISGDLIEDNTVEGIAQTSLSSGAASSWMYGSGVCFSSGTQATIGSGAIVRDNVCIATATGATSGTSTHGSVFVYGTNSNYLIDGLEVRGNVVNSSPAANPYAGVCSNTCPNVMVRNCFIVDNAGYGLYSGAATTQIVNCTIADNLSYGIYSSNATTTARNCIIWGNGDDLTGVTATYCNIQNGDAGTGNLNPPMNPMFVGQGDYHLRPGSPCIDRGENLQAPLTDFDGDVRPYASGIVEIGADEVPWQHATPNPSYIPVTPTATGTPSPTPIHNYYVDKIYGDDGNDGTTWLTAKRSVTEALTLASFGDCIHIAASTYYENLDLPSGILLLGGYPPGGGARNPQLNITVLDGSNQGSVVTVLDKTAVTVDGLTLMHGYQTDGGGLFCYDSEHVAFTNCTFQDNAAGCSFVSNSVKGGGALVYGCYDVWFGDCSFVDNEATADNSYPYGGGLYIEASSLVMVTGSIFVGNLAKGGGGAAACFNVDASVMFVSNEFTDNQAYSELTNGRLYGGAIYCSTTASPDIVANEFIGNQAYGAGKGSYARGGALYLAGSSDVADNHFQTNQARTQFVGEYNGAIYLYSYGGAIFVDAGGASPVTIEANHFTNNNSYSYCDNTAATGAVSARPIADAGAIYCNTGSSATITQCTILNNSAYSYGCCSSPSGSVHGGTRGGAVFLNACTVSIIQTIVRNCTAVAAGTGPTGFYSAAYGGGLYVGNVVSAVLDRIMVDSCDVVSPYARAGGGLTMGAYPVIFTNSFIVNNGNNGIALTGSSNHKIAHLTIANNGIAGIYGNTTGTSIRNCIVWNNGDDLYNVSATYSDIQDGDAGTGNIAVNPQLSSVTDFHLTTGSPCINAGTTIADPATALHDYDGQSRPQGAQYDMGADEFAGYPQINLTTYLNGYYTAGSQVATAVDLELRTGVSAETATTIVAAYSNVPLDASGQTGVIELTGCPGESFYLAVKHGNHLPVITGETVTLGYASPTNINLGSSSSADYVACYGYEPLQEESDAARSLRGGNANGDNYVNATGDFVVWLAANGTIPGDAAWDARADFNGNAVVNSADYSIWLLQNGRRGYVPSASRDEAEAEIDGVQTAELVLTTEQWEVGWLEATVSLVSDRDDRLIALDAAVTYDPKFLAEPTMLTDSASQDLTDFSLGADVGDLPNAYHFSRGALPGQGGLKLARGENELYRLRFRVIRAVPDGKAVVGFTQGFSQAVTNSQFAAGLSETSTERVR